MNKKTFPPQNQPYTYLQTNRSDDLGSLWSTFNLDFQSNLGTMRLAPKLVTNVSSDTETAMKIPVGFELFSGCWYAVTGSDSYNGIIMKIYTLGGDDDITEPFTRDKAGMSVGSSTTRFDVTNPAGTTFRYTYDGTGTNPGITTATFPTGATVNITATNMATGNEGQFTITSSGVNYFEVTNASGVVEADKTIGTGTVAVAGGTISDEFGVMSDIKSFNDYLWASANSALWRKDNNGDNDAWINFDSYSTFDCHQMQYFKKFDRLYYVADGDEIRSVGTDDVIANTGDDYNLSVGNLDENGYIYCMQASSNSIWIGLGRRTGSSESCETYGLIYEWDGISQQVTNTYKLETGACLALTEHEGVMYAVDSEGRILKQTGYSFVEIARLPIDRYLLRYVSPASYIFIHFNGFVPTKNNTLLLNIGNDILRSVPECFENLPGGIWELDLATYSLTHRSAISYKGMESSTITDYAQFIQRFPAAIKLNTINQSTTTYNNGRSTIVTGGAYYKDATTTGYSINIDSPTLPLNTNYEGQKRGYFVTTWFNADEIQDKWLNLWTTYRRFLNSTDKMIFKYRLNEEDPVYATITWTSTTTFTTTTDVSAYAPTATGFNGTIGGEVEVIQGTGGGSCTHITSVVNNAGTYTVTIDNAVTGVTGTAKARFQKWVKMFPEVTGQVLSYAQMKIGKANTRIQIKGVLEFTGDDEFHKFILVSNEDIQATG